jgi:hypothetical protein
MASRVDEFEAVFSELVTLPEWGLFFKCSDGELSNLGAVHFPAVLESNQESIAARGIALWSQFGGLRQVDRIIQFSNGALRPDSHLYEQSEDLGYTPIAHEYVAIDSLLLFAKQQLAQLHET